MIKCVIIDDEPLALQLIEDNLRYVNYIQIVAKCLKVAEALAVLQSETVDLIFCDIGMPGLNGIQLVKSLTYKPMIIFVTAFEKFAVEGFELDVVDYLVKPVPLDRFMVACHKAHKLFELNNAKPAQLQQIKKYIFIYTNYNMVKIIYKDIEYIEGLKDYVKINLKDQDRPIISRSSLKAMESLLPAELFFRVHKSYIINVDYVTQIRRGKIKTISTELPLSDNYRNEINKMIGKSME